jgi:hypothetical protein
MNKEVTRNLIKTRNAIRQKLETLKKGNIVLEEKFLPITRPLNTIARNLKKNDYKQVKKEFKSKLKEKQPDDDGFKARSESQIKTPLRKRKEPSFLETELIAQDDGEDDNEQYSIEDPFQTSHEEMRSLLDNPSSKMYMQQFHELTRKYVEGMLRNRDQYDFKYGIRHDPITEKFYIGNTPVTIKEKEPDLIIGGVTYKGTPGLYELLFKKRPGDYTTFDERKYNEILQATSAHRRQYEPQGQIEGNKSWKYKYIIHPILQQRNRLRTWDGATRKNKSGGGLIMDVTDKTIDYVHWDDPNELVDRLRLLLASQAAGHTGHINEINSIIEELQEAQIIQ